MSRKFGDWVTRWPVDPGLKVIEDYRGRLLLETLRHIQKHGRNVTRGEGQLYRSSDEDIIGWLLPSDYKGVLPVRPVSDNIVWHRLPCWVRKFGRRFLAELQVWFNDDQNWKPDDQSLTIQGRHGLIVLVRRWQVPQPYYHELRQSFYKGA